MDRDLAERIVDAVGEALGVDTGTVSDSRFEDAVRAVLDAVAEEDA